MADAAMAGTGLVGTAFSVIGTLKQANADARAAEFEAKSADESARVADRNAAFAIAAAADEEDRSRWESKQILGSIRAAYGASGVTMDGTPGEVLDMNAAIAESNALGIRHQGVMKAFQYREEAKGYRSIRDELKKQGEYIRSAGNMSAIGQGIMGTFGVAKDYYTGGNSRKLKRVS
jgi:hypothetical protein